MYVENTLLRTQPMEFFKTYAVSPPNDAGSYQTMDPSVPRPPGVGLDRPVIVPIQTLTKVQTLWSDPGNTVLPSDSDKVEYQKVVKGAVVYADVVDVDRDKPGAKTLKLSTTYNAGLVPVWYLPWCSSRLIELYIKDVGADMDNTEENPRIFFTAALSGCSVFVDGAPSHPRVVHAGINGKLKDDAANFWRSMLFKLSSTSSVPINDHLMELNKFQYQGTVWADAYKQFLQADHRDILTIKDVNEWASVFGIRYGRLWSFYVQRNATVSTVRVIKKSDVGVNKVGGEKRLFLKNTEFNVTTQTQKGRGLFSKSKTLYLAHEEFARPIIIEEIYPTRQARIEPKRALLVS